MNKVDRPDWEAIDNLARYGGPPVTKDPGESGYKAEGGNQMVINVATVPGVREDDQIKGFK